jgi:hypothetical protein
LTVAIKLVVTVGSALRAVVLSHVNLLLFFESCVVVQAVVRIGMLQTVQSVDVAADDLRHVLWLDVLTVGSIVGNTSFHSWRCLQRHNVLLEVWIITVHVFLIFKQPMSRLALTLINKTGRLTYFLL